MIHNELKKRGALVLLCKEIYDLLKFSENDNRNFPKGSNSD